MSIYKEKNHIAGIFFCVPVFILAGFEHSIANMFYLSLAGEWGADALRITAIALVGNAIGSWMINAKNFTLKEKE